MVDQFFPNRFLPLIKATESIFDLTLSIADKFSFTQLAL